jgi:hypothetical protein
MFNDGETDVYDEERSDWLSVVSDDLAQRLNQTICGKWRFTISELSCEFPQISPRWAPKMLTGAHKTQRMAWDFVNFFRTVPQRW